MIVSALISILAWLVALVATTLPSGSFLPANMDELFTDLIAYAWGWDWLLPMGTIFALITSIVIFFLAELSWNFGKYLIALVRGN